MMPSPYIFPGICAGKLLTPGLITETVCYFFGVPEDTPYRKTRKKIVVKVRSICWLMIRHFTALPLKQMGALYGEYDHTTVIHALQSWPGYAESDDKLRAEIEEVQARINLLTGYHLIQKIKEAKAIVPPGIWSFTYNPRLNTHHST